MKKSITFLSIICLVLALTGLTAPAKAAEPIKIGILYGFTGLMAPAAEEIGNGFKVAFEKFMPTAAGRPIELIFEDTGSKADLALQKAKKLVERDKVAILCGPLHGGHAMGVSAYTDKMKTPQFNPGTNTEGLLLARKWSFISGVPLAGISYPVGTFAYKDRGYRTCSVLATDRNVGHEFMKGFFLSFKALGGKVLQEQYFPPGTTQFAPYVAKLKKADFLASWIGDADGIAGFPALYQMGNKMPIIQVEHASAIVSQKAAVQMGKAIVGITTTTWYIHTLDNTTNKAFVKEFEKVYNVVPGAFSGAAYEGAQIIVNALNTTKGDTSPEKLRKALMQPMDTIAGGIKWTESRSGIHPIHIIQIGEDLVNPKVIKSLVAKAEVVEKDGKKMVEYSVVE